MTKEQIIEILKMHEHEMAGHNWLIGLDESDYILCADAILALQKPDINTPFFGNSGVKIPVAEQNSYPKEFVEDAIEDAFTLQEDDCFKYGLWTIQSYKDNIPMKFLNIDELYNYWLKEVKK